MLNPFLNSRRELRNGWWVLVFAIVLAAQVIPATIIASTRQLALATAWQALMVAIATAVCVILRHESASSVIGSAQSWVRGAPIGMVLGLGIWTIAAGVLWAAGDVAWRLNPNGGTRLLTSLGECLAIAVAEELIFRGFVFQRLIAGMGVWPAQLTMAAYFVLVHLNNPGMAGTTKILAAVNIFLAGLLFGAFYLRTRSLALPVALHFMLNFTQGSLLGFAVSGNESQGVLIAKLSDAPAWWSGGTFGLEASLPGTLAVLFVLAVVLWWPSRIKAGLAGK